MNSTQLRVLLYPLPLLVAAGCGAYDDSLPVGDEAVGEQSQEIIGGNTPSQGLFGPYGVVQVSAGLFSCTGTMVTNRHILTARHCVRSINNTVTPPVWNPNLRSPISVMYEQSGVATQFVNASTVWESSGVWPNNDHALLELVTPLAVSGVTDTYYRSIYTGTDASLIGTGVVCMGYGNFTLAIAPVPPNTPGSLQSGSGTLRYAGFTIATAVNNMLTLNPNAQGQTPAGGDSGGTCFAGADYRITGVLTGGQTLGFWDADGNGFPSSPEVTSIGATSYNSPNKIRTWTNNTVISTIFLPPYRFVPALPPGVSASARVTSLLGTDSTVSITGTTTLTNGAVRSGFVSVVPNEPPKTMCSKTRFPAQMSGNATYSGLCMADALVSAILG